MLTISMPAGVPRAAGESGHFYFGETRHFYLGTTADVREGALLSTGAERGDQAPRRASDATYAGPAGTVAIEFHHKAAEDSNANKISIYVLEKLKEYSINYGLADR